MDCTTRGVVNKHAPENTLAAFRRAEQLGADAIELDVQISKRPSAGMSRVPFVFHDQRTNRLTRLRGLLSSRTPAQIQEMRVAGHSIPSLQEALTATTRPIFLEVKDPHGIREILATALPHKERVTVITFYPHVLLRARGLGFKTGVLSFTGRLGWPIARLLNTNYLITHSKSITEKLLRKCQRKGVNVVAWGVEEQEHARQLMKMGVHGIVSDERLTQPPVTMPRVLYRKVA